MIHVCMVTLGGRDLVELAIASLDKYAGDDVGLDIVDLPKNTTDPWAHGRAIDFWRQRQKVGIRDTDLVAIMDPDCVLLSEWWRLELNTAFDDPKVGIWGAGASADFGPRVHASMMAIRGIVFNDLIRSFAPCTDPRESTWRDTGGLYCMWAKDAGWKLLPVERGDDWHGFSAWYSRPEEHRRVVKGYLTSAYYPMWTHLGGGTHSDPARMTRWERIKRWRAVQRRKRFKQVVREHLRK